MRAPLALAAAALTLALALVQARPALGAEYFELPPSGSTLSLRVGEQRVFYIRGIARVALEPKDVVDIKPLSVTLLVGQRPGRAALTIWKNNGVKLVYTVVVRR